MAARQLARTGADLLALGTYGRSGFVHATIGSQAETLLESADVDVHKGRSFMKGIADFLATATAMVGYQPASAQDTAPAPVLAAAAQAGSTPAGQSDDEAGVIGDIIVTAQKQSQVLQRTPAAVA